MLAGAIGATIAIGGVLLGVYLVSGHGSPKPAAFSPAAGATPPTITTPSVQPSACALTYSANGNVAPLLCHGNPNPPAVAFYDPLGLRWLLAQGRGVSPNALANDLCLMSARFHDTLPEAAAVCTLAYHIQGWAGPITPRNVYGYLQGC